MKKNKMLMKSFDLNAFSQRLNAESDRAFALLGGAVLDAKLEELFRRKLRMFKDQLLEGMAPLGTFSARIRTACALGWVSDDVYHDLDVIRGIRNDFAHTADFNLALADQSIAVRCQNLRTAQAFLDGHRIAASDPHRNLSSQAIYAMQALFEAPRWRYQLAVEFLAQHLDEVTEEIPPYAGSNLIDDVRALGASLRIGVSGIGTVSGADSSSREDASG